MVLTITSYIKKLLTFSLIIGILVLLSYLIFSPYFILIILSVFVFFVSITGLSHYLIIVSVKANHKKFISVYMLITFLKFMLFLFILLGYIIFVRTNSIQFISTFFIFYILYSVFEVISLISNQKHKI